MALSLGLLCAHAETAREELVHAHRLLKRADRNYDGHRVRAIEELDAAGRALGLEMGGELPEHERQWKSDAQLSEARRLLRDARDKLETRDREHAAAHVDRAIKEVDAALKVR